MLLSDIRSAALPMSVRCDKVAENEPLANVHAVMQVAVTDAPACAAVQYAQKHAVPVQIYPASRNSDQPSTSDGVLASNADLVSCLQEAKVDYVLLAGYLKLVPAPVVAAFHRRMLNIHPGLLPAFGGKGMYGKRVHQAVISSGARCFSALQRTGESVRQNQLVR
jgi:phosphoribosylglycinamide formyltransferase